MAGYINWMRELRKLTEEWRKEENCQLTVFDCADAIEELLKDRCWACYAPADDYCGCGGH